MIAVDWKNPDYAAVFDHRIEAMARIRAHPEMVPELKLHYRDNPCDFISDWGCTFDPRLVEKGLPALIPFVLFPKQREFIDKVLEKWREGRPLLGEKSRDCGLSYTCVALACTLGLFYDGFSAGFGSRKSEYVDRGGQPKSLFYKARVFMRNLPVEFRGGWLEWRDGTFMRITFPETGSVLTGEAGDQIGRGDRTSMYIVDEAAYLGHAEEIEASLSATTNCRIDISSVHGMNNTFARKRHEGKIEVFVFDWKDDPRKDQAWYDKQCAELDAVVVAQEIDRDYTASVSGIVIPNAWVRSCIDACEKLGITPTGSRTVALDVADEGHDKNAAVGGIGVEIDLVEEWSGKGGDIFETAQRGFDLCDEHGYDTIDYDADGLGAGVRGDARVINERRRANKARQIAVRAFWGSGEVIDPTAAVFPSTPGSPNDARTNADYFGNRKAQEWWRLRTRCQKTHRWVTEGKKCSPDEIVSFNSKKIGPILHRLVTELSQPTYRQNDAGKMIVNKTPDGMKSPNLGDGAMIRLAKKGPAPMKISAEAMAKAMQRGRR